MTVAKLNVLKLRIADIALDIVKKHAENQQARRFLADTRSPDILALNHAEVLSATTHLQLLEAERKLFTAVRNFCHARMEGKKRA